MRKREFMIGLAAIAVATTSEVPAMASNGKSVDLAALAALRPGMPVSMVERAMGSSWQPMVPYKGGKIDLLENSHGFVTRIDKGGLIGMITYDESFQHPVADIAMEMKLKEAKAAMPELEIGGDLPLMSGVRIGVRQFSDGYALRVQFTLETVTEITFANPTAEYPAAEPPPYPAASGIAGAPFADVNLKLAVLSSLLDAKVIDLGTPAQLAAYVLGQPVDIEEIGYNLIPEARDYLARYPLTENLLNCVETIAFDGGSSVYPFMWYQWDGEDDVFDIKELTGIANCKNLKHFEAISMSGPIDIRALEPLERLETLNLGTGLDHVESLLNLPNLKTVMVTDDGLYDEVTTVGTPARRVFDTLKSRGVRVWVHWIAATDPTPPAFE